MTPSEIDLVQKSFSKIAPIAPLLSDLFYNRLFELAPDLIGLFPTDLSAQKIKLIDTLATFVLFLHRMEEVRSQLRSLGQRHRDYGALDGHYELAGAALIATLDIALGPNFTPPLRDAWHKGYGVLVEAMIGPGTDHPT